MKNITLNRKLRRKRRVSTGIHGTKERPRIAVFRSNKYIYVQAIDDDGGKTLVASSSLSLSKKTNEKLNKSAVAKKVGQDLASKLKEKNISTGVFDRNIYAYLGRVKSLAEGLREGGVKI